MADNTSTNNTWGEIVRLWPLTMAIVGGIVFSIRQEGRINVANGKTEYLEKVVDHLTRAGEGIKDELTKQSLISMETKTIVIEIKKQLDNEKTNK